MGKVHDTRRTLAPSLSGQPTAALFTAQRAQKGVGGIDDLSDILRKGEERGEVIPVFAPQTAYRRVFRCPDLGNDLKVDFDLLDGGGSIDGFQISGDGLAVFPGYVGQAVTYHIHDAKLNLRFRIHDLDGIRNSR